MLPWSTKFVLIDLGIQFRSFMVKQGRIVLEGKKKKDCDVRPSVSPDFGGYKEPLFSAAPGKHKRAAQCSGVIGRRGLVQ